MEFQTIATALVDWTGGAVAVGLTEGEVESLPPEVVALDEKLGGAVREAIAETEFKGKAASTSRLRLGGSSSPVTQLILVGLGPAEKLSLAGLRQAAGAAAKAAAKQPKLALALPSVGSENAPPGLSPQAAVAQAIAEGVSLTLHRDRRFKSEPDAHAPRLQTVELLPWRDGTAVDAGAIAQGVERAQAIVSGVILSRELVSAPANVVTPLSLADLAHQLAQEHGLELKILERAECEALGMGAFLGVAQAADFPPKFVHLIYRPAGTARKKLAIVGKGLTFDSGGLNIKAGAGSGIDMMKTDMGGAAAVFGAAQVIGQLKPDVEVHFISAVTENMISGNAMRPGDILTASNGKTIEVNNTDAEGRLTLADALVYADRLGVEAIVDLATLTGACVVALGEDIGGLWTSDEALGEAFLAAAKLTGEKFWPMPLEEKYFESMKSVVADMKNTGARAGGAISAALFLKQFVDKTPWIHLDIAGPVWTDKDSGINPAGGTGFGVRTLVNWVLA